MLKKYLLVYSLVFCGIGLQATEMLPSVDSIEVRKNEENLSSAAFAYDGHQCTKEEVNSSLQLSISYDHQQNVETLLACKDCN